MRSSTATGRFQMRRGNLAYEAKRQHDSTREHRSQRFRSRYLGGVLSRGVRPAGGRGVAPTSVQICLDGAGRQDGAYALGAERGKLGGVSSELAPPVV